MRGIHDLLERRGYVKLSDYGLVLTPDRRILATRPAILDDGLGGAIVGWLDGDLAAAELEKWSPRDTPRPKQPSPRPLPPKSTKPQVVVAAPAPVAPAPVVPAPAPIPTPVIAKRPPTERPAEEEDWSSQIAAAKAAAEAATVSEPVNEEEWDWEIAMARARAAAEEVEEVTATLPPQRRAVVHTVPQLPVPEALPRPSRHSRPTLQQPHAMKHEPAPAPAPTPTPPAMERRTVIPVPTLPVASALQPVRRFEVAPLAQLPKRMPRATQQTIDAADETTEVTQPRVAISDFRR